MMQLCIYVFFFFNDTATTEIYTLSLHDALPILPGILGCRSAFLGVTFPLLRPRSAVGMFSSSCLTASGSTWPRDRKSTRLNSSHANISYAVFCLKKKKNYNHYA